MLGKLFDLTGKVALVAGGGGYLGYSICRALAAHGARVGVGDINEQAIHRSVDAVQGDGGQAVAVQLDSGKEDSIERSLDQVQQSLGPVSIVVNCATTATGKSHENLTVEDWQTCLQTTLVGEFLIARSAARRMIKQGGGGSIIHFGSMYGMVSPNPVAYGDKMPMNPPDYGAAKAGVLQLTRYQAVLWGKNGIRVNAVVPGPFPNPGVQARHPDFVDRLSQRVPMARIGQGDEIAGAVVYLASPASSYVTGTTLVVDGGWTAW